MTEKSEHMAATYQVSPPEQFHFGHPEEWLKWIRRFERFRKASGLEEKAEEAQVNTLIYTMGDDADDIVRSFRLSEEDSTKYSVVRAKFDAHFVKRRNVIYERAKFNLRRQEEGEPVDSFITALYGLAEHCGYGDLHDEMIRDRIVVGIRDSSIAVKLQLDAELTLNKAVTLVRQAEAVKQQQPLLRGEGHVAGAKKPDTAVGAVIGGRRGQSKSKQGFRAKQRSDKPGFFASKQPAKMTTCSRCGKSPPHDRQQCPAREAVCHKCAKRGHFQSVCRSTAKVGEVHLDSFQASPSEVFLGSLTEQGANPSSPWAVTLSLNGKPTHFEIDTGAECCKAQMQRSEPLIPTSLPELPWQKVATDLLEWRKETYLLIVDYYSRFIEIARLSRTTAEEVILHTKSIFARHGVPEVVISDNGPQYSSEAFARFAHQFEFEHITSSPLYPQSNGEAERAVKTVKGLLKKEGDPYLALLSYRATPLQNGLSPSELLMSRKLRTTVPVTRELLRPKVPDPESLREREEKLKTRQQSNFDHHHGVRELSPLEMLWCGCDAEWQTMKAVSTEGSYEGG